MDRRNFIKAGSGILLSVNAPILLADDLSVSDDHIKDSIFSEEVVEKDFILSHSEYKFLYAIDRKLKRLKSVVGYGNFNLIGLNESIKYARRYSKIGAFTKEELDFLEKLFYQDAKEYGFYGKKVLTNLDDEIRKKDTIKVPYTGHYLYKGKPVQTYEKIKKEVGKKNVILTSGVRGIIKQTQLFTSKIVQVKGNVSIASRSLAPPGYSYHGIGDFDVGKVGFGYKNFTAEFAKTKEYKKLMNLGYITIRYPVNNPFGVRFEPWHIKVNT